MDLKFEIKTNLSKNTSFEMNDKDIQNHMAPIPIYNVNQTNIDRNSSLIAPINLYNTKTAKTFHARYIFPKADPPVKNNWIVNDIPHAKIIG